MGQHLLLQDFLRIDGTLCTRKTSGGTTTTDKVEGDVAVLDDESLFDAWLEHLEHGSVVKVVADVLEHLAVGNNAERTEDNDDGDVVADIGRVARMVLLAVFSLLREKSLTCMVEMVLPPFSTALRISARKVTGAGGALEKT